MVDVLQRTAGPGRKADAENRADIAVADIGQHAFLEAARGLDRLAVEQPFLQFLELPGHAGFAERPRKLRPEEFPALLRVLVKTAARRPPRALELLHHAHHHFLPGRGDVRLALGFQVRAGLFHHVQRQRHRGLVDDFERPHRHAGEPPGALDHRRGDTLFQHRAAFHHEGAEGAAGVEAAGVVDHDRRLADGEHVVVGAGDRLRRGLRALDDLDQRHLVHRREEVQADEVLRPCRSQSEAGDRQRRGVRCEDAVGGEFRLGFLRHLRLEIALLEHRLDDQVASGEIVRVRGGPDQVERIHALAAPGEQFLAVSLALLRLLDRNILQHAGNAAGRGSVGDARAHHAGAEDSDLGRFPARYILRTRGARLDRVEVEEEGVDHVLRHLADGEFRNVARLDAHRGVEVHVGAFDHRRQDRLRRGIQAARLFHEHRGRHREHLRNLRRIGRSAGHAVVPGVPRLHWRGIRLDPLARHREQIFGVRGQSLQQPKLRGFGRAHQPALDEVWKCRLQAEQPCQLGDAARARQQAERDFWKSELDLRIVDADAAMRGQRHFEAAAERGAVDRRHHRLAELLQPAEVLLHEFDFTEHARSVRRGELEHVLQLGAGKERLLGGRQDHAVVAVLFRFQPIKRCRQGLLEGRGHGVDLRPGRVERDRDDPVRAGLVLDGHHSLSMMVAMPMPPPTHRVASP